MKPIIRIPEFHITKTPAKTETVTTQSRSIALADIHDGPIRVDTKVEEVTTPEHWAVDITDLGVDCGDDQHALAWQCTQAEALAALDEFIGRAVEARTKLKRGDHDN
jgi:hypothetical protein